MFSFDLIDDKDKVELERFKARKEAEKITYDFVCKKESVDRFEYLLKVLSSIEFGVNFDPEDFFKKEYNNGYKIRVKISGSKANLEKWRANVLTVLDHMDLGEKHIKYLKFDKEG